VNSTKKLLPVTITDINPSTSSTSSSSSSSSLSTGAIVGIVIALVVACFLCILLLFCLSRRGKGSNLDGNASRRNGIEMAGTNEYIPQESHVASEYPDANVSVNRTGAEIDGEKATTGEEIEMEENKSGQQETETDDSFI